jgi:hypothetical protein
MIENWVLAWSRWCSCALNPEAELKRNIPLSAFGTTKDRRMSMPLQKLLKHADGELQSFGPSGWK